MTEEIHLSDAEKRMLRRVFHRHALPYVAVLGLVALFALAGGPDEAVEEETSPVATALSVDVEALREAQARAEQLLAEVLAVSEKSVAGLDAAKRQIAALEKRLASTARRAEKAESVARSALKVASEVPPEAANVSKILERIHILEARQAASTIVTAQPRSADTTGTAPAAPANASP